MARCNGCGAAGGALVGGAGGGLIGAMIGNGVSGEDAHVYAESVRRGGCLVTARLPDRKVATAEAILAKHRAVDPALRGRAYREAGWLGFDPDAPVNTDEIEATRQRETQGPSDLPPLPAKTPPGRISGLAERPDADARR
jgi:hypothetical protein